MNVVAVPRRVLAGMCAELSPRTMRRSISVVLCVLVSGAPALRADYVFFSTLGQQALAENHLVTLHTRAQGLPFVVGQVVVPRDDSDQPTLPYPYRYFMFRPADTAFVATDVNGKPAPGSNLVRLEFKWIGGLNLEVDTLDDVRGLISNRDLRYATGADALEALLADIDPDGLLQLKRSTPEVVNPKIVPREGYVSHYLIHGPVNVADRMAEIQRLQKTPPEDPLSYNALDPRLQAMNGDQVAGKLLQAIARCEKYGEPEPGLQSSCFAVAQFLVDTVYVVPNEVPIGARDHAQHILDFTSSARGALWSWLEGATPSALVRRLATSPDHTQIRPAGPDYDVHPLSPAELAHAVLEIAAVCRTPRLADYGRLMDDLISCASGRKDIYAQSGSPALPEPLEKTCHDLGRHAFDVLLKLVTAPEDGSPDVGLKFRVQLRYALTDVSHPLRSAVAAAALPNAGLGSDAEIDALLDYTLQSCPSDRKEWAMVQSNIIHVLKHLPASIHDPARRNRFETELARRLAFWRQDNVGQACKNFIAQYDAAP